MRSKRNCALFVESLEGRSLLTGLAFNIQVQDPSGGLTAADPSLAAQVQAVENYLPTVLNGNGTVNVQIVNSTTIGPNVTQGAGGTSAIGPVIGTQNSNRIVEPATLFLATTGNHISATNPEIVVQLRSDTLAGIQTQDQYPNEVIETILLHEITHGLGFGGYRVNYGANYGTFTQGVESVWDSMTSFGTGGDASILYFTGAHAEAVYGGPVPLTSLGATDPTGESFNHVGNPTGQPGAALVGDLMNGVADPQTHALSIGYSALDLAILSDIGYSTVAKDATPATVVSANEEIVNGQDSVVVTFSKALDQIAATNAANYGVVTPGGQPSIGNWSSITYNASNQTVTLIPASTVNWSQGAQLVLVTTDESGLVDQGGNIVQAGMQSTGNTNISVSTADVPPVAVAPTVHGKVKKVVVRHPAKPVHHAVKLVRTLAKSHLRR